MTIAPEIPTTKFISDVLNHMEAIPHWERRLFIKRRMPGQYPRFFYKYLAIDPEDSKSVIRARDIVVRSQLWLANHERFNDPFDLKANVVFEGNDLQKKKRLKALIANQSGAPRKQRREIFEQMMKRPTGEWKAALTEIFRTRAKEIGVCSFANDPRSILMWSHYGKSHGGVCLQFEMALSPRAFTNAHPVEYSESYPEVNFIDGFEDSLIVPLLRKHKSWQYEGEWRLVHMTGASTSLPYDPSALRRIVMGAKASPAIYSCIHSLLRERRDAGLTNVELFRAEQHVTKYALELRRLPVPENESASKR